MDFMVKHGIKGLVGGGAATMAEGPIAAYRAAAARAGHHERATSALLVELGELPTILGELRVVVAAERSAKTIDPAPVIRRENLN